MVWLLPKPSDEAADLPISPQMLKGFLGRVTNILFRVQAALDDPHLKVGIESLSAGGVARSLSNPRILVVQPTGKSGGSLLSPQGLAQCVEPDEVIARRQFFSQTR